MDEMYGFYSSSGSEFYTDKALMSPENLILPFDYQSLLCTPSSFPDHRTLHHPVFGPDELLSAASMISEAASITPEFHTEDDFETLIKAKIKSHPSYPRLLQAYTDCQKVGAPPEIVSLLEGIRRESTYVAPRDSVVTNSGRIGADPELDEFMETYIDVLVKYKLDLARPLDEATTFLNKMEMQLSNLCTTSSVPSHSDEGAVSSDEDFSGGELEVQESQPRREECDLKDRLLRKFGSSIGNLKLEFSKKKKKGKLPNEARLTLLEWWNSHNKWPYPTEADKISLAESTGLDQKQINNWFINQRKRHWKPSEDMHFALLDNIPGQFYAGD